MRWDFFNSLSAVKNRNIFIWSREAQFSNSADLESPHLWKGFAIFYEMASLVAQLVKNLPAMQETRVWALNWKNPLEKGMATHSSILAWRIPWTEKPGGLQSMELQRVGQDWVTKHVCILYEKAPWPDAALCWGKNALLPVLFCILLFHSLTIEFEVRTEAESGLLFYMARINHADFATVQLKNGLPYFSYDLGSGDTSTMIPTKINDGQWHKVIVPGCQQCPTTGLLGGNHQRAPGPRTVLQCRHWLWGYWNVAGAKNTASAIYNCPT